MKNCFNCRWEPRWEKDDSGFCRWPLWRRNGKDVIDKLPMVKLVRYGRHLVKMKHNGKKLGPCREWAPSREEIARLEKLE